MGAGQVMDRGVAAEAVTIKAPASACLPAASTAATSTRATPSRTTQNSARRATGINSPSLSRDPQVSRGQANMLDRPILLVKTLHSLSQNRTKGRSFTQEGITPKREATDCGSRSGTSWRENSGMDLPRGHLVVLEGSQPSLLLEGTEAMIKLLLDFFCDGLVPSETSTSSAEAFPASSRQGVPKRTLSRRETEVLRLLAAGESNAQIARRLGISEYTIERHVVNIYRKIEARGRADATAYALRHGLG